MLPFSTKSVTHITDGTPHNCYSVQQSVCPPCCPVALTESPTVQDGTPHNCYSDQKSACLNCCLLALTVSPIVQTAHHTIAIVTNSQSALTVALLH